MTPLVKSISHTCMLSAWLFSLGSPLTGAAEQKATDQNAAEKTYKSAPSAVDPSTVTQTITPGGPRGLFQSRKYICNSYI
jgi:hypothetical protein